MISSPPDPDTVARAFVANAHALLANIPGAWERGTAAARTICAGIPIPTLNGVIALSPEVSAAELRTGLAEVDTCDVPYSLLARPACGAAAAAAAETFALDPAPAPIPLMAVAAPVPEPPVDGVTVRRVGRHAAHLHDELAGAAFDAPVELFAQVTKPSMAQAGARMYMVERDREPVATGVAFLGQDSLAVFNVATLPAHQRRGYGSLITARAVNDGFAEGARFAWLQSSAPGLPVYERLGFTVLERWSCWMST